MVAVQKLKTVNYDNMRLYDIPRFSKIYCKVSDGSEFIIFDHLDGMYSYCTTEKDGVFHLSAGQPLKKYKDGYELANA